MAGISGSDLGTWKELLYYFSGGIISRSSLGGDGFKFGGLSSPLMVLVIIGGSVLAMLPESPFRVLVNMTLDIPEARYWGWIIPIREFATFFEAVASCYYIYAMLYALLKYCNIVK